MRHLLVTTPSSSSYSDVRPCLIQVLRQRRLARLGEKESKARLRSWVQLERGFFVVWVCCTHGSPWSFCLGPDAPGCIFVVYRLLCSFLSRRGSLSEV
jgi:hypothetical protein